MVIQLLSTVKNLNVSMCNYSFNYNDKTVEKVHNYVPCSCDPTHLSTTHGKTTDKVQTFHPHSINVVKEY